MSWPKIETRFFEQRKLNRGVWFRLSNQSMAAPAGNQFWKLRSKHGRDKLFATPELLWEAAVEYFEWCDEHPLEMVDFRGKDATKVILPKPRPYTIQGLCLYLDTNTQFFNQFEAANHEEFSLILARIRQTIYDQKFAGASAGLFNHNIIARDLGLVDKKDQAVTVTGELPIQQVEIVHTKESQ